MLGWRVATLAALAAASALAITSSLQADGLDLRVASVTDMHTLVQQRRDKVDDMQARVAALTADVERLSVGVGSGDKETRTLQRQVRRLRTPAGFAESRGEGLKISMSDTPKEFTAEFIEAKVPSETMVVHQQDIQAVVNALWRGGATAISLMGHRIISTTGIKCVGNTVLIKNVPYAPPYKIEAIGDPVAMQESLYGDAWVSKFLESVSLVKLGWSLEVVTGLTLPAYSGTTELRYATPARDVT